MSKPAVNLADASDISRFWKTQNIDLFPPESIMVPEGVRAISEETVVSLMASIQEVGLQNPITVRLGQDDDGDPFPILIAGRHRLEAFGRLKIPFITSVVFEGSEEDARLWQISENLHRADLSRLERDEHIAEWVRLTEKKQSDAAQLAPHQTAGQRPGGINAAVRELGIDRTDAQRAIKVDRLSSEAKQVAREVGLANNRSVLLGA